LVVTVNEFVHPLNEVDRFQIFATAEHIGDPLSFLAAIVQVQHRGHGIDAQPVYMKLLHPIERV
jgi:hypothetical protein